LGATTIAPPEATLQTPEVGDEIATAVITPTSLEGELIRNSHVAGRTFSAVVSGSLINVTVSAHSRVYTDKTVSVAAQTITGLSPSTQYNFYYDDVDRSGIGFSILTTTSAAIPIVPTSTQPARHFVGYFTTPDLVGAGGGGGGSGPPGSGGGGVIP
jgi:hypothetical protein